MTSDYSFPLDNIKKEDTVAMWQPVDSSTGYDSLDEIKTLNIEFDLKN